MNSELLAKMECYSLQADTVSYNMAISACEKGQRWEMAFAPFEKMPARWLDADVVSLNAAISACEKGQR